MSNTLVPLPDEKSLVLGDNSPSYAILSEAASARDSVIDTCIDVDNDDGTAKLSNCVRGKVANDKPLCDGQPGQFLSLEMKVEMVNQH